MRGQDGNAALATILGIGALAISALYTAESNRSVANQIAATESTAASERSNINSMSNLSRMKGLITSSHKAGTTLYEPALFAANYFKSDWIWNRNSHVDSNSVGVDGGTVLLKTFTTDVGTFDDKAKFFGSEGKSQLGELSSSKSIQIQKLNYEPGNKYWVRSIDVKIPNAAEIGNTKNKKQTFVVGRIQVEKPVPTGVEIFLKGPGKTTFDQDFGTKDSPLPPGNYQFQVRASGVVHHASLTVGDAAPVILGLDSKLGVIHDANNIHAYGRVIGTTADVKIGELKAAASKVEFEDCEMTMDSSTSSDGSVATNVNVSASVYGVDGLTSSALTISNQPIYLKAESTESGSDKDPGGLACMDRCPTPWYGTVQTGSVSGNMQVRATFFKYVDIALAGSDDKTQLDYFDNRETKSLNDAGGKGIICANLELTAQQSYINDGHRTPSVAAMQPDFFEWWDKTHALRQYYSYLAPACNRELVGTRAACGCFEESTQILMANGEQKRAAEIRAGDLVWNPKTSRSQVVKRVIAGPEKLPLLAITAGDKTLRVTTEHPFLTTQGPRSAQELQIGDRILSGEKEDVVSLILRETRPPGAKDPNVWNFELIGSDDFDDHYVLANNVMTGDLYLQIQLKSSRQLEAK